MPKGYKTSDELGLVRIPFYENVPLVNSISRERDLTYWKEKYPSVFNEKPGKLKDVQIKLDIDESIKLVVTKRYPLPFHIRDEVEKMVQQGVADDIFEKASGPIIIVSLSRIVYFGPKITTLTNNWQSNTINFNLNCFFIDKFRTNIHNC